MRGVPDVAADANPGTAVAVVTSNAGRGLHDQRARRHERQRAHLSWDHRPLTKPRIQIEPYTCARTVMWPPWAACAAGQSHDAQSMSEFPLLRAIGYVPLPSNPANRPPELVPSAARRTWNGLQSCEHRFNRYVPTQSVPSGLAATADHSREPAAVTDSDILAPTRHVPGSCRRPGHGGPPVPPRRGGCDRGRLPIALTGRRPGSCRPA
jgi:hypothetical protein